MYLSLQGVQHRKFVEHLQSISDWGELVDEAEAAALSNILFGHLKAVDSEIPSPHDVSFKALAARHIRNNRERTKALAEILYTFNQNNIQSMVLKGMALIHTLYNKDAQRPMGDIDILVSRHHADHAQELLRQIGYNAEKRKTGYLYDHHHLPVAHKIINGMNIQVEIHHNALSGDATSSMDFSSLYNNRIKIEIQGQQTSTMGHIDMLRHLCHHTFEPIDRIKLGAIADIYGYATRYRHEIDWQSLKKQYPFVSNTLRCLHYLSPMPDELHEYLSPPTCPQPMGVGLGFPTLSSTFNQSEPLSKRLQKCFKCSAWWLHIFYTVPPESSLVSTRWFVHPLSVTKWLLRRGLANSKSRLTQAIRS